MYSGYSDMQPPGHTYAPIVSSVPYSHGYDSSLQPGSPQPLDLSLPRDDGRRNSSYTSDRSSAKTESSSSSVRYSPYRNQTPSPSTNIARSGSPSPRVIQRLSPAPYTNHRNSPFSRANPLGPESPYLYHELYTATNVLNEAPGGSSVPVSSVMHGMHRYEERDILTLPVRRSNSPPMMTSSRSTLDDQRDHNADIQNKEVEDNQVIIMDLDPPTQKFQAASVNSDDQYNYKGDGPCYSNSQSKSFLSTSENKSQRVSSQAAPFTQQFSPDSSSETSSSATKFSQRPSVASSLPPPASTSTNSRPYSSSTTTTKTSAAAVTSKKPATVASSPAPVASSPSSSPKPGSSRRSPDSPKSWWFQNQDSARFMIHEQMLKLGQTQKTTDILVNLMFADIKSRCRGIERYERDGVPKIRMPMYHLIETQVEEMIS